MAGHAPESRASAIQLDGRWRKIKGLDTGAYNLDQLPQFLYSTEIDLVSATSNVGHKLIPYDYTVVNCFVRVPTAPDGSAALLTVGTTANTSLFVNNYSIATSVTTTTLYDLAALQAAGTITTFIGGNGSAGDIIVFNSDGGGSTVGKAHATLVIVPR